MDINEIIGMIQNVNNLNASELQSLTGDSSGMQQAAMAQAANEMRALQAKGAAGNGILTQDEINRFVYLRNMLNPNLPQEEPVGMPMDIDGASAGTPMNQEALNNLLQKLQRMRY